MPVNDRIRVADAPQYYNIRLYESTDSDWTFLVNLLVVTEP